MDGIAGHQPVERLLPVAAAVGDHPAQVAQGEDADRIVAVVDHHQAADVMLVHQFHRRAQADAAAAGHRVGGGEDVQAGFQRILGAEGFCGLQLHLLVHLAHQAADPAQGEVAEGFRLVVGAHEGGAAELQAEGVLGGDVVAAGGPLADHGRHREALARGDLLGGLQAIAALGRALAQHQPLLDDVDILDRAVAGTDDGIAGGIEAQPALLDHLRQMAEFHLVERGIAQQKVHGALDVLHHGGLADLREAIVLAHLVVLRGGRPFMVRRESWRSP
ncbi:hypothetical protein D3C80_1125620 [compost metagenome]